MAGVDELLSRLDSEFSAAEKRTDEYISAQVKAYQDREQRQAKLGAKIDRLREVWKPRLEAFAKRFGERVKVSPTVQPGRREAKFEFKSELAHIEMRLSVASDEDARQLVLSYDVDILPVLMQFERHEQFTQPLDSVDEEAVARWVDDRLVQFTKTYLALHENQYYLKEHLVEDPVAGVRFPKYAAAATLDSKGKTYYFISEKTCQEFQKRG
jgi:YHS domain-containing protein